MKTFKKFQESLEKIKINYSFILNNCSEWMTEVLGNTPKNENEIKDFLENENYNFFIGIYENKPTIVSSSSERLSLQGNITLFSKEEVPTLKILHETFKNLGFDATPLNSFVCYTSKEDAIISGGKPYLVFPMNGYKYTYSPFVNDILFFVKQTLKNFQYNDDNDTVHLDEKQFQNKFKYRDTGLGEYVKLRKDFQIFLHGTAYFVKL